MIWPEASAAPGADDALAQAIGNGPVVIGVEGDRKGDCRDSGADVGAFAGTLTPGGANLGPLGTPPQGPPCFGGASRSIAAIDTAAAGHGLLSNDPDDDGVFRRLRLLSQVGGHMVPDLTLDIYRLAAGAPYITLLRDARRIHGVGVGQATFPVERDGGVRLDFSPRAEWTVCSAGALLDRGACQDLADGHRVSLEGKIVLIGVEVSGFVDMQRQTPLEPMPGVEIRAQGLENLLEGRLARRPAWAPVAEPAMTLLIGMLLIALTPLWRGGWRVAAVVAPLALALGAGTWAWGWTRLLVDVATPTLGGGLVLLAMLGGGLVEADAQRRRLRRELEDRRLAAARAEGELEAGRRIQMGILPLPGSLGPDGRFDLFALMVPARQIGGDLYDFFWIDPDRLYIAVGDVSGKGVPASLFMALGKSLCKSCALRGETDIGAIVRRANQEISRDNPEMLFITLFAGILDLQTGTLSFCNAGHDAPILVRPGQAPRDVLGDGGPPLCVVDDFPYATETHRLEPGDLLCVTTDGVIEAMTSAGALMGRGPVDRVLADLPPHAGAEAVTVGLQAAVERFVAGAEPSDDLTILTLRWHGPKVREQGAR